MCRNGYTPSDLVVQAKWALRHDASYTELCRCVGAWEADLKLNAQLLEALTKLVAVCEADDILPHVRGHIALARAAIKAAGD